MDKKEMPVGINNIMKRLGQISEDQGGQHSRNKDTTKEQQSLRVEAIKQITRFPEWKPYLETAMGLVFPRLYMRNKRKTKQNRGGMIDYRKKGLFR
jgi:hypothetical protein